MELTQKEFGRKWKNAQSARILCAFLVYKLKRFWQKSCNTLYIQCITDVYYLYGICMYGIYTNCQNRDVGFLNLYVHNIDNVYTKYSYCILNVLTLYIQCAIIGLDRRFTEVMAKKVVKKTGAKTTAKPAVKKPALEQMTTVSFRTRQVLKKKAEAVFDDLGISMSAAINMFLSQTVREKGLPFQPNAERKTAPKSNVGAKSASATGGMDYIALEELWDEL